MASEDKSEHLHPGIQLAVAPSEHVYKRTHRKQATACLRLSVRWKKEEFIAVCFLLAFWGWDVDFLPLDWDLHYKFSWFSGLWT